MGITDPIEIVPYKDRWILKQGRETFYVRCDEAEDPFHYKVSCWECDHLDELITFESQDEAANYATEHLKLPEAQLPLEGFFCPKCGTVYSGDLGSGCLGCQAINKGGKQ